MPVHFHLQTPEGDDRPVYVSGNFCRWYPDVPVFQMQPTAPGAYELVLPDGLALPDLIEYKYNRGGWDSVELSNTGEGVHNRTLSVTEGTATDYVPHWRLSGRPFNPEFLPKVELLSDEFDVPQLQTTRRINVLLPYDYHETDKQYPVLYLHDGQNLFGEGVGFGSWNIDQRMAVLAARRRHEVILVSIDHGEEERIKEFSPYRTRFGRGKGRQYLEFIARTLKPAVDARYRTRSDHASTGIGGSSMGGLISIYAGLMYPDVFGRLMIFSPSLWLSPKIYFDAIHFHKAEQTKVYIYGGEAESTYMVPNIQRLHDAVRRQGIDDESIQFEVSVDPAGEHNEAHWSREFPKAVEWLFY
ncbi:alpha/beta hydrolase [Tellurirhabdus rosea]|uniref:alpha/beta hydrolase n=1 Tax=Tellurirhabdus rosea TaxID=2674997 RepID=UPI0022589C96|nr:alpha/beta hydrolase-fold protein [Tellurirhabdus rosea]